MIKKLIHQILFILLATSISQAINVEGNAFLEFQTDHSGIKVLFEAVTPSAKKDSTYTNSDGSFSINVQGGVYNVIYSKGGFDNAQIMSQGIFSDITLSNVTLLKNIYLSGTLTQGVLIKEAHYIVISGITLASEDNLIIEPGAELRFDGDYLFRVDGLLTAVGTVNDSIIFTRNRATEDSKWKGIYFIEGKDASRIEYCKIEYVQNSPDGGAIFCYHTSPTISHNLLQNNLNSFGGAISCEYCSPVISENIIKNNTAHGGAGIYLENSSALIYNNLIVNNYLDSGYWYSKGTGINCRSSSPEIINNTIIKNTASSGSEIVAGIYIEDILSQPIVKNNTISENSGYGIYVTSGNPSISYNDLWNNSIGSFYNCPQWVGDITMVNSNGDSCDAYLNILFDPKFVDINNGYYQLSDLSPCIGAATISGAPNIDIEGNIRPAPPGTNPDIGAYENALSIPVPVELSRLTAISNGEIIILEWTTQSETGNLGFNIYRSLDEKGDYKRINTNIIHGAGTSSLPQKYDYVDYNVKLGNTYYYKIAEIDFSGNMKLHGPVSAAVGTLPKEYVLLQNYPNPFNPTTIISFDLPEKSNIKLRIFNIVGKEIEIIKSGEYEAGHHEILFNIKNLTAGLYFYRLESNNFVDVKKMTVLK